MYLVYIDDSGDPGLPSKGSPTDAFVLSALLVKDRQWLDTLDQVLGFRRFLRDAFGLRVTDELKAQYLVHGSGPFAELQTSDQSRLRIYQMALRLQEKLGVETWAIVIDKHRWEQQRPTEGSEAIRELAWRYMVERIERFTSSKDEPCTLYPDEGNSVFVRGLIRKMRRFSHVPSAVPGAGSLSRPATLIVEDPNFRKSHESYFVQLADLNSYAAYRHIFPHLTYGRALWERLGEVRVAAVSRRANDPRGIVVGPR